MRADSTGLVTRKQNYASAESSALKLSWYELAGDGWSSQSKHPSLKISSCDGWVLMTLGRFIRLHYSHLFRVDTLITPPKGPPPPGQERWISSATLLEQQEEERDSPGSNNGKWSPINVLRTPMIPATPDQTNGNRRSPTPLFLRENSPSSPLTPLHFIRKATVEPGGGLTPSASSIREKSPGISSDGGGSFTGSVSGRRPRLSASATPGAKRVQQLQPQGTLGGRRPWR